VRVLPEAVQAKLLKVLEDGVVRRLGSSRTDPVDAAIVAATSEDLVDAVQRPCELFARWRRRWRIFAFATGEPRYLGTVMR
jgi:transcriptional regulator with AAA-type ATPase domain